MTEGTMTKKEKENYIRKIWTDPGHPGSFAGPDKLYNIIRNEGKYEIGRGTVKKVLSRLETYSVQKPVKKVLKETELLFQE